MISAYRLINPLSPYVALLKHRTLIFQMARRDVVGRYRGSFIGMLWSFINPLLMLGIYTFVFGVIFASRWGTQSAGTFGYAVMLFVGLNLYMFFAECANRAPTLIIENTNFVKKVVFPLETLAWSVLGAALFHLFISTIVLLAFAAAVQGTMPWTIALFPIIVAVFLPFVAGTVWLLSSLGVFLRDLKQAMGIITSALMFLAPIFYPMERIPAKYQGLVYFNPLTLPVEASQAVLIRGQMPDWAGLGIYAVGSCLFGWLAFTWFERTRQGFADVL